MGLMNLASRLKERYIDERQLPNEAKQQLELDRSGLSESDAGPEAVAAAGIQWLKRSQDKSLYQDGGSARDYSLVKGCGAACGSGGCRRSRARPRRR